MIILEADNLQETLSSTNFVFITFLKNLARSLPVNSILAVVLAFHSASIHRSKAEPSFFVSWCSSPLIRMQTMCWPGTSSCLPLSPTPLRAVALAGAHVNCMGWVTHRKPVGLKVVKVMNQCISLGCSVLRMWFGDVTEPILTNCRLYWKVWSCFSLLFLLLPLCCH